MSDEIDIDAMQKAIDEAYVMEKKLKELKKKKLELDERRVNFELKRVHEDEEDLKKAREANFGNMSEDQVNSLVKSNEDYIEAAKNRMMFIDPIFDAVVPYFRSNIILVGAKTGDGKSTTVANIARTTIALKNEITGQHKKVLVITNEERAEDFYNRITCLIKGWSYTNHDRFTPEMTATFTQYIKFLGGSGLITVVDDSYSGGTGQTTTIEGIESIFNNLIKNEQYYDVILLDYVQNCKRSKEDHKLNEWQVQQKLAALLDRMKNIYPAPIIVMAQVNPNKEDENVPFQYRVKGAKVIADVATLIVELIADRENLRTGWQVHKSRFTEGVVGKTYYTGYDRGRYVSYDEEFRKKVQVFQEKRQLEMMNKLTGTEMNKKIENNENPKN
jgi:replicative DNA helicase